jgi:hypothetical protein
MTPIDLLDFTQSKKKIPSRILKHQAPEKVTVSNRRALIALMLDFGLILGTTTVLSTLFKFYFSSFMISQSLQTAMYKLSFYHFSVSFLPLMFMSYFFFSNFFNHGQSWGMHVMKTRINIPEQHFKSSLLWAMFSSATVMTFGLSFFWARDYFEQQGWGTFEGHDHLYIGLIQERNLAPVNLVKHTQEQNPSEEEIFVEAA